MGENCTNLGLDCGPLDCAPVSSVAFHLDFQMF